MALTKLAYLQLVSSLSLTEPDWFGLVCGVGSAAAILAIGYDSLLFWLIFGAPLLLSALLIADYRRATAHN